MITRMLIKSGEMVPMIPSQESKNLAPKMDVEVIPQQTSKDVCTNVGSSHHPSYFHSHMCVSLGCILGSMLPNVSVLKKYQYASWDRYFRVSALVVPNFMILSDRLVTMILLLLWTLHLKAEYNLSHVSSSRSPINSTTNSLLSLFEFDKLL